MSARRASGVPARLELHGKQLVSIAGLESHAGLADRLTYWRLARRAVMSYWRREYRDVRLELVRISHDPDGPFPDHYWLELTGSAPRRRIGKR